jgi:hypothetical protein
MKICGSVKPIFIFYFRTYIKFGPVFYVFLFTWVKFKTGANNNLSNVSFIKIGAVKAIVYVRL